MLGAKAATQYATTVEQGAGQGRAGQGKEAAAGEEGELNCSRGRGGGEGGSL